MNPSSAVPVEPPARTFRNADRLHRIRYLSGLYMRLFLKSLGRVPPKELLRTQFPFSMSDAPLPPLLSVELTNHCNLGCDYCTNPTSLRPRGVMDETTLARLLDELAKGGTYRVSLCGNGEPTIHPRFVDVVRRLSLVTPHLSVTSNWQRINDDIAVEALYRCQEINVSVDGADPETYETRRKGGSFRRLLFNLDRLVALKRSTRARALINIRVMLLPSERSREREVLSFWRRYGDIVSRQYVLDFEAKGGDLFSPASEGRCTLPFKKLDLHWNGVVNLCSYSWIQVNDPEGVVLGNIREKSLSAMWNSDLMRQYREGHRRRQEAMTPICKGCPGRT